MILHSVFAIAECIVNVFFMRSLCKSFKSEEFVR